jgi:DNA-binding GntR family transcriptional regulator
MIAYAQDIFEYFDLVRIWYGAGMAVKERASTEAVHARMRADVLAGVYAPGEKLKFADLCERYAASVAVVRESLTRLVEQGLAVSEPRIGFRVAPLTL